MVAVEARSVQQLIQRHQAFKLSQSLYQREEAMTVRVGQSLVAAQMAEQHHQYLEQLSQFQ